MKLVKSLVAIVILAIASWSVSASTFSELSGHTFNVSGGLAVSITGSCTANGYSAAIPDSAKNAISRATIFRDVIIFNANKTFTLSESGRSYAGKWQVNSRGEVLLQFTTAAYSGVRLIYDSFKKANGYWPGNSFTKSTFSAIGTYNPTTKVLTVKQIVTFTWKFDYSAFKCSSNWKLTETLSGKRK